MDVLIQLPLFGKRTPKKPPVKPLVCAFGTPWLDHFPPPVGTGKGCAACWRETWGHDRRDAPSEK